MPEPIESTNIQEASIELAMPCLGEGVIRPNGFRVLAKKFFPPSLIQASAVIADQGFCSIAHFLAGVLVARACTKSEYGIFVLGITILSFLTQIQNSLVSIPYTIQYPRFQVGEKTAYLGSTLIHQLLICVLTTSGFFVTSGIFAMQNIDAALVSTMFMLSVASFAFMIREFIRFVMLAEFRVWLNLTMSLVANISTISAMFIAYKTHNLNSAKAYLIIAVCSGVPAFIITGIYWHKMTLVSRRIVTDFKDNFHLGKWLLARTFANMGAVSIYPLALAAFNGTADAGVYGACFQLASLLNPIFIGLNSFLRPKFSHLVVNNPHKVNMAVLRITGLLSALLALIFVVMIFFGNWTMIKIYGQDYADYNYVLLICVFAVSISAVSGPISIAIDARKNTISTFIGRFMGALFSLTIGVLLVWKMGLFGAVISLVVAQIISLVFWSSTLIRNTRGVD
jgi:O-antigen/teichoic acid export membrane protein